MAYETRTLHTEVTTTLAIVSRDAQQVETPVDADAVPTAEIRLIEVLVESIAASDVTHVSTGVYTFTWTPERLGFHVITWSFTLGAAAFDDGDGEGRYTSTQKILVVADIEGTSTSVGEDDAAVAVPAIGANKTCTVTGRFFDASGEALVGVYVRFTPDRETDAFLSSGIVALDVTTSSDREGNLSLRLVRGMTGTISIAGLGITRRVTVPNVGTIPIQSLVELGDDPLEVQRPKFKSLQRRS